MPNWFLIASTIFSGFIIAGGTFLFPYVPSFFGVTDYKNATGRGKLIVFLIKLFPITSILALYLAWTSISYLALFPFLHFWIVYIVRENKNLADGPQKQFKTEAENLESIISLIGVSWNSWDQSKSEKNLLLSTFFAENENCKSGLEQELENSSFELLGKELSNNFKNGSMLLDIEISLASLDRANIEALANQLTAIAWKTQCELRHIDVFAIE